MESVFNHPQETEVDEPRSLRAATLAVGVCGSVALALAMGGTLSAFTASITNDTNSAGVGSLTMRESGPNAAGVTVSCDTTATQTSTTCSTINKYGGSTTMTTTGAGSTKTTSITLSNTGSIAASSFTLVPGACTLTNPAATSGDLCSLGKVTITQDGAVIARDVAPSALTTYTLTPVAAGQSSAIDITFSTVGLDNTVSGQSISQPLTWTFNA